LKKYFHACNEGIVRSGAIRGCLALRICADKIIIIIIDIERGADLQN